MTLKSGYERRPDLVLYLNGIAVGVLELKNSRVSIGDGIRQSLSNQRPEFNALFFSTVQFVFAGNDAEGLRYGAIGTPEKYFLKWKEDEAGGRRLQAGQVSREDVSQGAADRADARLRAVRRRGQKAAPAAPVFRDQGSAGILPAAVRAASSGTRRVPVRASSWCCSPSGFCRTTRTRASLSLPDRDELDKQIEGVFQGVGEPIARAKSGRDLSREARRSDAAAFSALSCTNSGRRDVEDFDAWIKDLEGQPSPTSAEIFVFVDECHRTQSGQAAPRHEGDDDRTRSSWASPERRCSRRTGRRRWETFGRYIHTYKFSEAVEDEVVLDLVYEARDIDQRLGSEQKIEAWFDAKTKGLNDWQEGRAAQALGHHAERAQFALAHEPRGRGCPVRFQRQAAPVESARQRDPRRVEHLRSLPLFRAVSEHDAEGKMRPHHLLQSECAGT